MQCMITNRAKARKESIQIHRHITKRFSRGEREPGVSNAHRVDIGYYKRLSGDQHSDTVEERGDGVFQVIGPQDGSFS